MIFGYAKTYLRISKNVLISKIPFLISKNNYGYPKLFKDIQYSIKDIQKLIMDIQKLIMDIHKKEIKSKTAPHNFDVILTFMFLV